MRRRMQDINRRRIEKKALQVVFLCFLNTKCWIYSVNNEKIVDN